MISRLHQNEKVNPIREHINISFKVGKKEGFLAQILQYLRDNNFNVAKSRALVFVKSRKKTEEFSEAFNQIVEDEIMKSGFFHAGMDAEDRKVTGTEFEEGTRAILFATKAFGMGMDIPNIHFLFHIQPSTTFEDFLQEVGRAGRNKSSYQDAGFNLDNPIKSICYFEKEDFAKTRDLMLKSEMSWGDVVRIGEIIKEYYCKFRPYEPNTEDPLPIPLNLLDTNPHYAAFDNTSTLFRLGLYWLEKLERYETTYYVPSFLEFSNSIYDEPNFSTAKIIDAQQRALIELILKTRQQGFQDEAATLVDIKALYQLLDKKNLTEAFKLIIKAQTNGIVFLNQKVKIEFTKMRMEEIDNYQPNNWNPPTLPLIEAIFNFVQNLLIGIPLYERKNYNQDSLNEIAKETVHDYFVPEHYTWVAKRAKSEREKDEKTNEYIKKQIEGFKKKRIKHAFWLINIIPKIKCESIIDDTSNEVINIIYNNTKEDKWLAWLNIFKENIYRFLNYLKSYIHENGTVLNVVQSLIDSEISVRQLSYFDSLLIFLKKLGYLHMNGGLIPMSLELYLTDITPVGEGENDDTVLSEFKEVASLRKLRLATLEAFAHITDEIAQSNFIETYFKCGDSSQVINLLEQHINEDNANLISEFREEALNKAEKGLSPEQRAVYGSPINQNTLVTAGPGSGKTHTLTLRVARLIQKEKINPENILVLAYNRAVVIELKERLSKLFAKLGYKSVTRSLKVFTFHGLVKYCLRDKLEDVALANWETTFLDEFEHNSGLIKQRIGTIFHVFVDEFQDITTNRLNILQSIVLPEITHLTVIGDPNQSIYGFERVNNDEARSPLPYYEQFQEVFQAKKLRLTNNYRSYAGIIQKAEDLLTFQEDNFNLGQLNCVRVIPENAENYVFENNTNDVGINEWRDKLTELTNKGFKEIALMTRTNEEIYRLYDRIRGLNINEYEIRIQGESGDFLRSREVGEFIDKLTPLSHKIIPGKFSDRLQERKIEIFHQFPHWDRFYLNALHAIFFEFFKIKETDSTYGDLLNFLEEFAKKDDGQLFQIYQLNKDSLALPERKEIILTTMHRVKGLEFDSVIVMPSFHKLSNDSDELDEEIRLRYVAYTRARDYLTIYNGDREAALINRVAYEFPNPQRLGYQIKTGIEKFVFNHLAKEYIQSLLINQVKIGDPVILQKDKYGNWGVKINNYYCGRLSNSNLIKRNELQTVPTNVSTITGYYITSLIRYTAEESRIYDTEHRTNYTDNWDDYLIERGWILIPDFAGFGKKN